jgi:hypothetical protein
MTSTPGQTALPTASPNVSFNGPLQSAPEPSSCVLLLAGSVLAGLRFRRKKAN